MTYDVIRELAIYQLLQHSPVKIIPTVRAVLTGSTAVSMVLEHGGIELHKADKFCKIDLSRQLLLLLCHWTKMGVVHRDIKPQNILVSPEGKLSVIDWGIGRIVGRLSSNIATTGGMATLYYRPPEVLQGHQVDPVFIDIWSVAITIVQLFAGNPLGGINETHMLFIISKLFGTPDELHGKDFPQYPIRKLSDSLSVPDPNLADLLDLMLVVDPTKRITIDQIMTHPFMRDFATARRFHSILPDNKFPVINHESKRIMFDWLFEKFRHDTIDTIIIAFDICREYLSKSRWNPDQFKLIAAAATLIAEHLNEVDGADEIYAEIVAGTSISETTEMMRFILKTVSIGSVMYRRCQFADEISKVLYCLLATHTELSAADITTRISTLAFDSNELNSIKMTEYQSIQTYIRKQAEKQPETWSLVLKLTT